MTKLAVTVIRAEKKCGKTIQIVVILTSELKRSLDEEFPGILEQQLSNNMAKAFFFFSALKQESPKCAIFFCLSPEVS